jgi:hypothetical protein
MFTAYESAERLDDALDMIDDGRALDPRTAAAFEHSLNGLVARDQKRRIAAEVAGRVAADGPARDVATAVRVARWLRVLPDGPERAESVRVLEEALKADPDDPRLHRELGAWWLGAWRTPGARDRARDELLRAAGDPSAAIMRALLTADPRLLERSTLPQDLRSSPRFRMARAALAVHRRESTP